MFASGPSEAVEADDWGSHEMCMIEDTDDMTVVIPDDEEEAAKGEQEVHTVVLNSSDVSIDTANNANSPCISSDSVYKANSPCIISGSTYNDTFPFIGSNSTFSANSLC